MTNQPTFNPMRSLMFISCADEEYRIRMEHFLFKTHVPESISIFEPYCTKYAFYSALPIPEGGERFGAQNYQLTEHHWLTFPELAGPHYKALGETFPPEVLQWQGVIPKEFDLTKMEIPTDGIGDGVGLGDLFRSGKLAMKPMVSCFIPMFWEVDVKGEERTIEDGPNYRWQVAFKFPDDAKEEGHAWVLNDFLPAFAHSKETTRILSSKVIKEPNDSQFDRIVEIWFSGPSSWKNCIKEVEQKVAKPDWATTDTFPYMTPEYDIQSIFLSDIPRSNNLTDYRGFITMR